MTSSCLRSLAVLCSAAVVLAGQVTGKPRLIVLTDIGGDPDDQQSLVRLLTYANEFQIEGLISSASGTPGELKQHVVRPDLIRETVNAYGRVRSNLARHARGYPAENHLLSVIKSGNPQRGVNAVGPGKDTEGSDWIVSAADGEDERPLHIAVWGGPTDLAQALWRVKNDRSEAALSRFVSKLRVYAIGHQDDSGPWILENFPDLFYVLAAADPNDVSGRPQRGPDRRLSLYRGMYLGGDQSLTSRTWIDNNVRTDHGSLGALYPSKTWTAPNPHSALKEGDTPSWFYFLPLGLSDPEHPEWGGWGGRFRQIRPNLYNDAPDTVDGVTDARASIWRWRPAFQSDFAARMDWCVSARKDSANHPPQAALNGDLSRRVITVEARGGREVRLSAARSKDPDGDRLSYRWFVYREAGTYAGTVRLSGENAQSVAFAAPQVVEARTIHVVLEVTDDGKPALTSYRRAVIAVEPEGRQGE